MYRLIDMYNKRVRESEEGEFSSIATDREREREK